MTESSQEQTAAALEHGAAEHLTPMAHAAQNRCFGCGEANAAGLHLHFFLADDGSVVSLHVMPDTYEGPVGYVHGGIIATLLDETMSKAVRAGGMVAMTRRMEVDYLRPAPLHAPLTLEGRVTASEGRKHWVEACVLNAAGDKLAESKGLFIEVRPRVAAMAAAGGAESGKAGNAVASDAS